MYVYVCVRESNRDEQSLELSIVTLYQSFFVENIHLIVACRI